MPTAYPTAPTGPAPAGKKWVFNEDLNDGNGGYWLVDDPTYVPPVDPSIPIHAEGSTAPAPTAAPPVGYHWAEAPMRDGSSQGWQLVPNGKAFADTQVPGYRDPLVPVTPTRTYAPPTPRQVQDMISPQSLATPAAGSRTSWNTGRTGRGRSGRRGTLWNWNPRV